MPIVRPALDVQGARWQCLALAPALWTKRATLRAGLFCVVLGVMVSVPILQVARGAEHFRWRMFGDVHQLPTFRVIDAEGHEASIAPAEYTAALRGDVDYRTLLPPHLCEVLPNAASVRVHGQGFDEEYTCQ